ARHAADRKPPAAAGARFRRGQGDRHRHDGGRRHGAAHARGRRDLARPDGPQASRSGDREVRRRAGRRGESFGGDRRGARDDRGRAGAFPHPAGLPAAHVARTRGDRARVSSFRPGAGGEGKGPVLVTRIAVKPTLQPELFAYSFPVRVYFENTDAGGVVYHGEYLKFLERARTEWLRHLGFDHQALARDHRLVLVVTAIAIDFLRPARLDDTLAVSVRLESLGK